MRPKKWQIFRFLKLTLRPPPRDKKAIKNGTRGDSFFFQRMESGEKTFDNFLKKSWNFISRLFFCHHQKMISPSFGHFANIDNEDLLEKKERCNRKDTQEVSEREREKEGSVCG